MHLGLLTPRYTYIVEESSLHSELASLLSHSEHGVAVKPPSGGSSQGVLLTASEQDAQDHAKDLLAEWGSVLIEERLVGEELTVSLTWSDGELIVLPPLMSEPSRPGQKIASVGDRVLTPFVGHPANKEAIFDVARRAFQALGNRDWGRVDLVLGSDGRLTVLEVNSAPGLTATSPFSISLDEAGIELEQWGIGLIQHALDRQIPQAERSC